VVALTALVVLGQLVAAGWGLLDEDVADASIQSIVIDTRHGYDGGYCSGRLAIEPGPAGYVAGGAPVPRALVDELVRAAREPRDRLSLEELGLGDAARREHPSDAAALQEVVRRTVTPTQWARFEAVWLDGDELEDFAARTCEVNWTHDWPDVEVVVDGSDGRRLRFASREQLGFMLPWEVDDGGVRRRSYSARFSRALAALLPPGFCDRERIAGTGVAEELEDALLRRVDRR
jgi:hypothetical protein